MVGRGGVDALIHVALRLGVSHEDDAERPAATDVHAVAEEEVVHHAPDPKPQPAAVQRGVVAGEDGGGKRGRELRG